MTPTPRWMYRVQLIFEEIGTANRLFRADSADLLKSYL
jgi:hypothetical protein